jgi:hypothetical protein
VIGVSSSTLKGGSLAEERPILKLRCLASQVLTYISGAALLVGIQLADYSSRRARKPLWAKVVLQVGGVISLCCNG